MPAGKVSGAAGGGMGTEGVGARPYVFGASQSPDGGTISSFEAGAGVGAVGAKGVAGTPEAGAGEGPGGSGTTGAACAIVEHPMTSRPAAAATVRSRMTFRVDVTSGATARFSQRGKASANIAWIASALGSWTEAPLEGTVHPVAIVVSTA